MVKVTAQKFQTAGNEIVVPCQSRFHSSNAGAITNVFTALYSDKTLRKRLSSLHNKPPIQMLVIYSILTYCELYFVIFTTVLDVVHKSALC